MGAQLEGPACSDIFDFFEFLVRFRDIFSKKVRLKGIGLAIRDGIQCLRCEK